MAGYTRQSASEIVDGEVIQASDFNNEFQQLLAAFNDVSGHSHNGGSSGEGAPITVVGPNQEVVIGATTVTPAATNTVDVGSSSLKFKDLYLSGAIQDANVDLTNVTLTGTTAQFNTALSDDNFATLTGTETLTNKTVNSASNTLTVNLSQATVTGTTAEFNTALSDDDFATLTNTVTLTNKTLTSPTITTPTISSIVNTGTLTLPTSTDTLVGRATTDTLTNKTINSSSNTLTVNLSEATVTGTTAEFNTALSDGSFATLAGTETLTNKSIDLTDNTLSGTTAEFNTALSDGSFTTLAGTETLTNKTLTTAALTNPTVTNYVETLNTSSGATYTVDLANGTLHKFTTTANATITLPSSVAGKSFIVIVAYGGAHTLTFSGGGTIKWAGGSQPTATSSGGAFDIFTFMQDGTNTYGVPFGLNF